MQPPQRFNPYKQFKGSFIPLWLLERTEISPGAKLIYARLALHAGEDGDRAFPGIVTLAQEIGLPWTEAKELPDGSTRAADSRSVRAYLKELVEKGLIESVQRGFNKPNRYYFLRHEWMEDGLNQGSANFADPDRQDLPIMIGKNCRLKQTDLKDSEIKESETTTASVAVENFGEGKEKEKEEGYTLLRDVGVTEGVSRALSKSHPVSRIREMIDLARSKNRSNTPGFIVTGLKEGWESGNRGSNIDDLIARFERRERGENG